MAITTVTTKMSAGVNYTVTTESSVDWPLVGTNTYFYDLTDQLVHFKNGSGDVLEVFSASGGSSGGIFGISDATGTYTYYATLTLAMAAAVSGEVIEMFADVVETGATIIIFKDGVNIHGNGHTYTKNTNDATQIFEFPVDPDISCTISGLTAIRSVGSGSCINFTNGAVGFLDLTGCVFKNTGTGYVLVSSNNVSVKVIGGSYYGNASQIAVYSAGANLHNIFASALSTRTAIKMSGGQLHHSYGFSPSGFGIDASNTGVIAFSEGVSTSGNGINCSAPCNNIVGRSVSGIGFDCVLKNAYVQTNVTGISVSGTGFRTRRDCDMAIGTSSSGNGILLSDNIGVADFTLSHFIARSTSNSAIKSIGTSTKLYNGTLITSWDNALGYCIEGNGGIIMNTLVSCVLRTQNASAPYIFNQGVAKVINMSGNTYIGGSAFNVNITNGITNTEDSQGNIYH